MPFNQVPEFMVNQLKRDGYYVMDQRPWKITLRRDVSDGTVVLNICVNKQNKVWHVKYMPSNETFCSVQEG